MAERPWERLLREELGDAWERAQDDVTSLVAETVDYWPDVLDDDLRWSAAASLVLDLLGRDDEVHDLLRSVLVRLYEGTPDVVHFGRTPDA